MAPRRPSPLAGVIGQRIRELREQQGWTQDRLAQRARDWGGMRWTRSMLAKVERGERSLSLEEFLMLPWVLVVHPRELFAGDDEVGVTPETTVPLQTLRQMFCADFDPGEFTPAQAGIRSPLVRKMTSRKPLTMPPGLADDINQQMARLNRRFPWAGVRDHVQAERDMGSEAVQKAAHSLARKGADVAPFEVALAARQLWGRSLVEQREEVLGRRTDATPDTAAGIRRHITRSMIEELRTFLATLPE